MTEAITGLDLVEWQLRVASGERLPKLQHEMTMIGHAIEARVYAEDPDKGFLPSIGRIDVLNVPTAQLFTHGRVRIDSGVREGDTISPNYDPMIAKLIVHGATRGDALARMAEALEQFHVIGPTTNLNFLHRVVTNESFAKGGVDTGFIAANHDALFANQPPLSDEAAIVLALHERGTSKAADPWNACDGWWLGGASYAQFRYTYGAESAVVVRVRGADDALEAQVTHEPSSAVGSFTRYSFDRTTHTLHSPKGTQRFDICAVGTVREIQQGAQRWRAHLIDPYAPPQSHDEGAGHLRAPMPGTVISVLVKVGDTVAAGAPLLVMEAMKMEHTIKAPTAGTVAQLFFKAGEQVKEGAELVEIAGASASMEPLAFKDTIGGLVLLASIVVVRLLYFPFGHRRAQRFPRLAGIALIGTAIGLLAAAYWTFSNLSGNRLEDTFMIPIGLGMIVAAMISSFLGARKIQSSNDAGHGATETDAHRVLASLEQPHHVAPRTPMSTWILAALFTLGVFGLYSYPAISTGIVRGKKSDCRIPEDVGCTLVFFGIGCVVAIVSTLVLFLSVRRLLRWLRG